MFETHAQAALTQFGKSAQAITVPLTTLRALCKEGRAPASFDFLKIDVEGAEPAVLLGGDWTLFRPKVIVVEALAPYSLAPAWEQWEPFLAGHGYHYVWFDSLNRYYLAAEAGELEACFATAPATFDDALQFRNTKPALGDPAHPDHRLAVLIGNAVMTRLPVLDPGLLLELLTHGLTSAELDRSAQEADLARIWAELLGPQPAPRRADLGLPPEASIRSLYAAIAQSDLFRAACGRISASYGW
jgi:hypothetical protein